jgi:predicted RNase H-like HicB family nuclease
MENSFTGIIEKTDNWYIGFIEEIPGVNTQGKTLEEVKENLKEALELILISNRQIAEKNIIGKSIIKEKIVVNV